jgi:hypothetical protein
MSWREAARVQGFCYASQSNSGLLAAVGSHPGRTCANIATGFLPVASQARAEPSVASSSDRARSPLRRSRSPANRGLARLDGGSDTSGGAIGIGYERPLFRGARMIALGDRRESIESWRGKERRLLLSPDR